MFQDHQTITVKNGQAEIWTMCKERHLYGYYQWPEISDQNLLMYKTLAKSISYFLIVSFCSGRPTWRELGYIPTEIYASGNQAVECEKHLSSYEMNQPRLVSNFNCPGT